MTARRISISSPIKKIRKTENPFLRREVAGCRQAGPGKLGWADDNFQSGPAGPEPIFYQNSFLDQNQMGEFVIKNCTGPTDRHKIDFLKIYISHFFQA